MRPVPSRSQLKIDFEYDDRAERLATEFGIMLSPHVPTGTSMESVKALAGRMAMLAARRLEKFEARIRQQMRDDRPLKREGTVGDVAEAVLYFATDRSRYVTGTVLPVDGGTTAGKVMPPRTSAVSN